MSIIGVIIFPMYLEYIGGEAYGLIGFFVLLQAWMLLFDMGMSPTLSRQVAISNSNAECDNLRRLLRSLETIFLTIAIIISLIMVVFRLNIAQSWLKVTELDINDVAICIALMGVMLSMRWFSSLYKSGINGYEKQVWVNILNIIIITLRMPTALVIFIFYSKSIVVYFIYQFIISILEIFLLNRKMYSCLPRVHNKYKIPPISYEIIKIVMPFALSTAYTAGIWVFLTQLDKLLLSKILTLSSFGYFSLIVTLVGGILMLSTPVSNAILPRLTGLLSRGEFDEMVLLYRKATKFICCVIFPIAFAMIFFPYEVMYGWTGNETVSNWALTILPLYALGNALLGVIGFQYYLQYAYGKLKLHVIYNTILACISIPAVYIFAIKYGAVGTGYVWVSLNIITLFFWTYFVHRKFLPGLHLKWLLNDVLPPLLVPLVLFSITYYMFRNHSFTRIESLVLIGVSTSTFLVITFLVSFFNEIKYRIKMVM